MNLEDLPRDDNGKSGVRPCMGVPDPVRSMALTEIFASGKEELYKSDHTRSYLKTLTDQQYLELS